MPKSQRCTFTAIYWGEPSLLTDEELYKDVSDESLFRKHIANKKKLHICSLALNFAVMEGGFSNSTYVCRHFYTPWMLLSFFQFFNST